MLKSITGVYIGGIAAVSFADYICNFFLVCFIFDGGPFPVRRGTPGYRRGVGIGLYGFVFILLPEDSTLSVCGRGTPNAHSLGSGGGRVKSG